MTTITTTKAKGNTQSGHVAMSSSEKTGMVLNYVLLILLAIIFLIPFYVILRNAFLPQRLITSPDWTWLPLPPSLNGWNDLLGSTNADIGAGLKNSAIIAILQTFGQMLICSLAGYGLARIPFKYSNLVFSMVLVTLMIPATVTFVPSYVLVASFGWVSTFQGLIVPGLFSGFNTFLFRSFFLGFPKELEEAGLIDGLDHFGVFFSLVLPNSLGILMSLGVITFIGSWNAFLWPLVIGQRSESWTVQIVLSTFMTAQTVNLPAIFMGATVAVVPLVIVFLFMQQYIVEGVKMSGIKG
jgi:multiple sugar transport system permease protein